MEPGMMGAVEHLARQMWEQLGPQPHGWELVIAPELADKLEQEINAASRSQDYSSPFRQEIHIFSDVGLIRMKVDDYAPQSGMLVRPYDPEGAEEG